MKETFKTFPDSRKFEGNGDDKDYDYDSYIVAISTWFLDLKKEAREILTNLEKETNALLNCKSEAISRDQIETALAYEQSIKFNKGRIFSLKQLLGDLPP